MQKVTGKVRYGVVGGGSISQGAFMPGVGQTDNSQITALVTGDPEKASELAELYQIKAYAYEDFGTLLSSGEVDAVYIATPNFRHREFVVPALEAGIHVLLEKPMATNEADCKAMIEAAQRSGAKLMIAYRLHCEPGTLDMVERVHAGNFGDPRLFTSTFTQRVKPSNHRAQSGFDAGPVPDMGPYPLNMVRQLFNAEPVEVSAIGVHTPGSAINTWDTVTVSLRFPDERLAQFTVSYTLPDSERFQLLGTEGEIEASPCFGYGEGVAISYRAIVEGETRVHVNPVVDQFAGETAYFSDCILNDEAPEPDGEEGWRDVRVVAAIERALETGQPQKLEPLPARPAARRAAQRRAFALAEVPPMIGTESPTQ
ncbi:Gfo/Idh/MocA family oxidoreductase [Pseudomonas sp. S75]|uniref:Gfo/Idh/MocA family protein n=1 Tax=unclassified Pseudomonas TaxID=196821 RepID=UPI0019055E3B|nr:MULTISPECIES: Gfo/Idh/MocA family oxidoreductase [unclassified Pseudomonas]MBJ9975827.1 Gfo/Idh/MocA family oxidoreductase [Pseudomonas sp. S30]MBK0154567.1 Gfo/Idh/MocA family oxidoreductase [Pseudomonas sp. S75]